MEHRWVLGEKAERSWLLQGRSGQLTQPQRSNLSPMIYILRLWIIASRDGANKLQSQDELTIHNGVKFFMNGYFLWEGYKIWKFEKNLPPNFLYLVMLTTGWFHLYLSELAFINQYFSIMARLVPLSLGNDWFRNHFTISSKYFDMTCYLKWEASSSPISFEVQRTDIRTDIWTDSII